MKSCRIVTLYSGSGGNSVYVKVGGTAILIDAGKSARSLCRALNEIGSSADEISAVFVTHDHHDHISALEILTKKRELPVHMTDRSAVVYDRYPDSVIHRRLKRHTPIFTEQVGDLTVTSFPTPHDSLMSVGYRIEFEDDGVRRSIGVATDIGYVTDEIRRGLCGCEAVVLESNHDVDMLMNGPYPYDVKQRIRSRRGHLSNQESAELASYLAGQGTRGFLLAHLSEENNEPALALDETVCAISDPSVTVLVADPELPTELTYSLDRGGR